MSSSPSDRHWNQESQKAFETCVADVSRLEESDRWSEVYSRALCAMNESRHHSLSGILRSGDELLHDDAHSVRFSIAMQSMKLGKYLCAYAAWDDGGRCWSAETSDPKIPDSRFSASVMMSVCDELVDSNGYKESALCGMMEGVDVPGGDQN